MKFERFLATTPPLLYVQSVVVQTLLDRKTSHFNIKHRFISVVNVLLKRGVQASVDSLGGRLALPRRDAATDVNGKISV